MVVRYLYVTCIIAGMKRLAVAVGILISLFAVTPAAAWICQPGVPDTPENQAKGLCVEITPTPKKHHKTPTPVVTATPVPTVATPVATVVTPAPTTAVLPKPALFSVPVATVPPTLVPIVPASTPGIPQQKAGQVCHYDQGVWSMRPHYGDTLQPGDKWPTNGICQEQATPVETPQLVNVPVETVVNVPTETPVVPEVAPDVPVAPPADVPEVAPPDVFPCVPELMPLLDEQGEQAMWLGQPAWLSGDTVVLGEPCADVPIVPTGLPDTGDGSTYGQ
jgi:hypothetical protein